MITVKATEFCSLDERDEQHVNFTLRLLKKKETISTGFSTTLTFSSKNLHTHEFITAKMHKTKIRYKLCL